MKLPIYELKINESLTDEAEVSYVALVDEPAIQKDFLMFKQEFVEPQAGESEDEFIGRCVKYVMNEGTDQEQALAICYSKWKERLAADTNPSKVDNQETDSKKEAHRFEIVNEEKRIISGPLMIADELIYRNNDKFGEHYVKFTAETIKQIAIKFAKRKYQDNVNLMHDPAQRVEDVTMFESWIVDKQRGILPMQGFEDVADGSWFGSFYVENDEVWSRVKAGEFRGFSVEGLFDYTPPKTYEEEMLQRIKELLYS